MDLRSFLIKTYQDYILQAQIPMELKLALRTHERIPRFIDNLCREIKTLPTQTKRETIELVVRDLTRVFIEAVKRQADERQMSDLAKSALRQKQTRAKELEALAERMSQDDNEQVEEKNGSQTTRSTVEI